MKTSNYKLGRPGEPQISFSLMGVIFLSLAAGYFLSFFYRSINAMIAPHLVAELKLSSEELGFMTAVYFLGFGLFQLPLGLLLDRFGPARVQSVLMCVAAIGAIIFSSGDTIEHLILGRGLIGVGVAGSLMSAFTAFAIWFPKPSLPMINGCFLGFGGLGALAAAKPVELALTVTGWRELFTGLATLTFAVGILVILCLPRPNSRPKKISWQSQIKELESVYTDRLFQRIAPLAVTTLATGLSIQSLWAATWLRDVANMGAPEIANHLSLIAIGLIVGPGLAGFADRVARRSDISPITVFGGIGLIFMALQALILIEWIAASYFLWACFGLFINATAIAYAILSQASPRELVGRVNTNLNMLMIFVAFGAQYLVGWLIGLWPLTASGGYAPEAYQLGFGALLIMQVIAFVWFLFAGYGNLDKSKR